MAAARCPVRLVLALTALSACNADLTRVRECRLDDYSYDDRRLLEYQLVIPANCPVPIGTRGEVKQAGAFIYDYGYSDFRYGMVVIRNSNGGYVEDNWTFFVAESDRAVAYPNTMYRAATGSSGSTLPPDQGTFRATNQLSINGSAGDAFGIVTITYAHSAMTNRISGDQIPRANTVHTWSAAASGGATPYTYHWYRDSAYVGTGTSYTASVGTRDFILRAEATDAAMAIRAAVFPVRVNGVLASVRGPSIVYAADGGGTWTAGAQGGTAPYSFDWYVDGHFIDSGTEYSGYPGEGSHSVRVDVADAVGRRHTAEIGVKGIGSEDPACDPTARVC